MKKNLLFVAVLFALATLPFVSTASNLTIPKFRAQTITGAVIPSAKLYFYEPTTTTLKNTYSDAALATPNTNPVVADASGWFGEIWMIAAAYKIVLKDAAGATIWTADNYYPAKSDVPGLLSATSSTATSALTATNSSSGAAITATNSGSSYAIVAYGGSNSAAITTLGGAGGLGLSSYGGTTSGGGGGFYGGAPNGRGSSFFADGTAEGVFARGGDSSGTGGSFEGGAPNGKGVLALGDGTASGVSSTGGDSSGTGGSFTGGATNGIGISATGVGTGDGANFYSSAGYGVNIMADTTAPVRAALRLAPQDDAPSSPSEGDIYYNGATHHLYVRLSASWVQLDN